jgi:hypothetical protein
MVEGEEWVGPSVKDVRTAANRRIAAGAFDLVQQHHYSARDLVYVLVADRVRVVKIGLSTRENFRERLGDIQSCCPVKLSVALKVPGNRVLELQLHAHFAESRLHGEWFTYNQAMGIFLRAG